jgi:hypothetical protein
MGHRGGLKIFLTINPYPMTNYFVASESVDRYRIPFFTTLPPKVTV